MDPLLKTTGNSKWVPRIAALLPVVFLGAVLLFCETGDLHIGMAFFAILVSSVFAAIFAKSIVTRKVETKQGVYRRGVESGQYWTTLMMIGMGVLVPMVYILQFVIRSQ